MRGCAIVLLFAGCAADVGGGTASGTGCPAPQPGCDAADCMAGICPDEYVYACDESTGEWVAQGGICEARVISIAGRAPLSQRIVGESGACPRIVPRAPLLLDAYDDETVAVAAPAVLIDGENIPGFDWAEVHARVDDDWYGVAIEVDYGLQGSAQTLSGTAGATVDTCTLTLDVDGPVCPAAVELCDTIDAGWTAQCQNGVVRADDLTTYSYCAHGATTPACTAFGARDSIVLTCPAACADETVHAFATTADLLAFDPASLCAP